MKKQGFIERNEGSSAAEVLDVSPREKPRARDLGVVVGILPTGPLNAIVDVAGVKVGHVTIIKSPSVNTGVTAILPHGENVFENRVAAAVYVGNGFGKLTGSTQVDELGELETPIVLTNTLSVWRAADALARYMISLPGMEDIRSVNPVVGETNDGYLNDIRRPAVTEEHVIQAIQTATVGPVAEGAVGAGAGTTTFGWKGGIGTSSRRLPKALGGYTVGVLVQTNFGGVLTINGAPVGRELGQYSMQKDLEQRQGGSVVVVVATDAPLNSRGLKRVAKRVPLGIGRTGSRMDNGSGDYVIAFSTAQASELRLPNEKMSPIFQATIESTQEAIYNALFKAHSVNGHRGRVEELPTEKTVKILEKYNVLHWDKALSP
ncbi:MAG: P1 family peptidase [Myxococcota bacterium]